MPDMMHQNWVVMKCLDSVPTGKKAERKKRKEDKHVGKVGRNGVWRKRVGLVERGTQLPAQHSRILMFQT